MRTREERAVGGTGSQDAVSSRTGAGPRARPNLIRRRAELESHPRRLGRTQVPISAAARAARPFPPRTGVYCTRSVPPHLGAFEAHMVERALASRAGDHEGPRARGGARSVDGAKLYFGCTAISGAFASAGAPAPSRRDGAGQPMGVLKKARVHSTRDTEISHLRGSLHSSSSPLHDHALGSRPTPRTGL